MKRKLLSLFLTLSILISMIPVTAIRAHAAETWYAPIVRQVMEEYGYQWLQDYKKSSCRGELRDIDGDGFEELVLVIYENGSGDYVRCQVWDLVDGAIMPVFDQSYYFIVAGFAVTTLRLDGDVLSDLSQQCQRGLTHLLRALSGLRPQASRKMPASA